MFSVYEDIYQAQSEREKANKQVSMRTLGEFVRRKREALGYSRIDDFAKAFNLDRSYISRLENGKQFGSPESLKAVALALGVNPGFLFNIYADTPGDSSSLYQLALLDLLDLPEGLTSDEIGYLRSQAEYLKWLRNQRTPQGSYQTSEDEAKVLRAIEEADAASRQEFEQQHELNKIQAKPINGNGIN